MKERETHIAACIGDADCNVAWWRRSEFTSCCTTK